MTDEWPDVDGPLNPSLLEDALSTDNDDRRDVDWHVIEMAAEKWLSENRADDLDAAQADRPPSISDNFSEDEIAAALTARGTLGLILGTLAIRANHDDPMEIFVQMVSRIEEICSAKDTVLERAAADLWRAENPQQSVFDCDGATKVRYRARAALSHYRSKTETPNV